MVTRGKGARGGQPWGLVVATLAVGFMLGRATAPSAPAEPGAEDAAAPTDDAPSYVEKKTNMEPSPTKGPDGAKVVIHEISDFQCPFCSRAAKTIDEVVEAYPNDVQVVFKHNALSFHKEARLAAIASMAAARQGHFWKYHDVLFANQKALKEATDATWSEYATAIGIDAAKMGEWCSSTPGA